MAEYIEREALLKKICNDDPANMEDYYYNAIKEAPTVDVVEVRHGEWEVRNNPIDDPKGYFIRIICSECGLITGQKSNYCPFCGAKMDKRKV